jgi:hypothetical protein
MGFPISLETTIPFTAARQRHFTGDEPVWKNFCGGFFPFSQPRRVLFYSRFRQASGQLAGFPKPV